MSSDAIKRRLAAISSEVQAAQSEIAMLDEQIAHFADTAEDLRLRAMVSETPLADREHREASKTVNSLSRDRQTWAERLATLEAKQDRLLDELMEADR